MVRPLDRTSSGLSALTQNRSLTWPPAGSMIVTLPPAASAEHLTKVLHRPVAEVTVERSFPTVLSHIFRLRLAYEGDAQDALAKGAEQLLDAALEA